MSKNARNYNNYNQDYNRGYGRKSSNNSGLIKFLIVLATLIVVIMIAIKVAVPIVIHNVKKAAAKKTVELVTDNLDKIAGDNEEIKEFVDNMSDEDKEAVTEIIANNLDADSVTEVMGYVNDGDVGELMEYAAENVDPSDLAKLKELYEKYTEN